MMYARYSPSAILAFKFEECHLSQPPRRHYLGRASWTYLILQRASIDYVRDVLAMIINDTRPVLNVDVWVVILDGRRWLLS